LSPLFGFVGGTMNFACPSFLTFPRKHVPSTASAPWDCHSLQFCWLLE
jgi:hypothetical protein